MPLYRCAAVPLASPYRHTDQCSHGNARVSGVPFGAGVGGPLPLAPSLATDGLGGLHAAPVTVPAACDEPPASQPVPGAFYRCRSGFPWAPVNSDHTRARVYSSEIRQGCCQESSVCIFNVYLMYILGQPITHYNIAPLFFRMAQYLELRFVLLSDPRTDRCWASQPKHVSNPA